jgi:hypothetical protein
MSQELIQALILLAQAITMLVQLFIHNKTAAVQKTVNDIKTTTETVKEAVKP